MTKPTITEAHGLALAEYAERAKTPAPGDETIHFWDYSAKPSACGVDIFSTPYTYGSLERDEITCPACINLIELPCRSNVTGNHEYEPDREYEAEPESLCGQPADNRWHEASVRS